MTLAPMKAMILAAGKGSRLRPLTEHTPKPLLPIKGKPLIVYHLEQLARAGFKEVIINLGHLGAQIPKALGDGSRWGLTLHYSDEGAEPLETGGGILQALPLLGPRPFWLINGDTLCRYPLNPYASIPEGDFAKLWLVAHPTHVTQGDFGLTKHGRVTNQPQLTYSGSAIIDPLLFSACQPGHFGLAPLLRQAIENGKVSGERLANEWLDVGTLERLQLAERRIDEILG
ncbi:MAG: nucleotidyltransferase family protein [Ferrimonas sp.]